MNARTAADHRELPLATPGRRTVTGGHSLAVVPTASPFLL